MTKHTYDALVGALRLAHQRLRTFSASFPEYKRDWTGDDSDALEVIEKALSLCEGGVARDE